MFTRPATVDIVLDSLRFLIGSGLKVYAFVILENHLHLVAQSEQLDIDMARFKSFTARQLIRYLNEHNVLLEHLVAQSEQLDIDMARFKSFTARQLIRYLNEHNVLQILDQLAFYKKAHKTDRTYQFWQEGCHPTLIENHKMLKQRVEYIHDNPVKRGYVDKAEHWRYSSARNYHGQEELIEVCTAW